MKLPDVDRRIVYGILSLVAVAVLLLIFSSPCRKGSLWHTRKTSRMKPS